MNVKILPIFNREPRVVVDDKFCSTKRKNPGRCVYLNLEKTSHCSLFDKTLEKVKHTYLRCEECHKA